MALGDFDALRDGVRRRAGGVCADEYCGAVVDDKLLTRLISNRIVRGATIDRVVLRDEIPSDFERVAQADFVEHARHGASVRDGLRAGVLLVGGVVIPAARIDARIGGGPTKA